MKRPSLTGVVEWGLALVLLGVAVHAPLTVWLGTVYPDLSEPIKAWKEGVLALVGLLLVAAVTRRRLWLVLLRDRMVQLGLGFIIWHIVVAIFTGGGRRAVAAGLLIDLRFVAILLAAYVLVHLRPTALKTLALASGIGMAIVLIFGVLQITVLPDDVLRPLGYSKQTITPYTTIDSNPEYVRINSTLRGPNPLGAVAVIYLALALAYLVQRYARASVRRRILAAGIAVTSVAVLFASYSRSAYLAAIAAAVVVAAAGIRVSRRAVVIGVALGAVIVVVLGLISTTDWFSNVVLHEDPESATSAKSNQDHLTSLATGLNRTITQPFGAGVGTTGSASLYDADKTNDLVIENQYFFVAHESGWVGLGLFVGLLISILRRLWRGRQNWVALGLFAGGIGLVIIGMVLPVWVDETVALTWWGMTGAVIAGISGIIGSRDDRRTRQ